MLVPTYFDMSSLLWHAVRGMLYRADDILISSASANIAIEAMADLLISRMGIAVQQVYHGDDHAGRAETALQAMLLPKGILHGMQVAIGSDAFNRGNAAAVGLHCQDCAGFNCDTIHQHGARTALTGITTYVRARQTDYFAQEMREQ